MSRSLKFVIGSAASMIYKAADSKVYLSLRDINGKEVLLVIHSESQISSDCLSSDKLFIIYKEPNIILDIRKVTEQVDLHSYKQFIHTGLRISNQAHGPIYFVGKTIDKYFY